MFDGLLSETWIEKDIYIYTSRRTYCWMERAGECVTVRIVGSMVVLLWIC